MNHSSETQLWLTNGDLREEGRLMSQQVQGRKEGGRERQRKRVRIKRKDRGREMNERKEGEKGEKGDEKNKGKGQGK